MKRAFVLPGIVPVVLLTGLVFTPQSGYSMADTTPPNGTITINSNRSVCKSANVALALTWDDLGGSGVAQMRFSDDGANWSLWEQPVASRAYMLPIGDGYKTVRVQFKDVAGNRSAVFKDYIRLDTVAPTGGIAINGGTSTTTSSSVTLGMNWADEGAGVTRMRFSDNGSTWSAWAPHAATKAYRLPEGLGYRTVRVQYMDAAGNYSAVYNDYIKVLAPALDLVAVPAGTFPMGNTGVGEDAQRARNEEFPIHSVTLSAYELGKYEVTNQQYCDMLNWALARGRLFCDTAGTAWPGTGDIYAGDTASARKVIMLFTKSKCNVTFSEGLFAPKIRKGYPRTKTYSMASHPMLEVTWFGAVAYCNWLSQKEGLTPCYDMGATGWPLVVAPPTAGGYRLPTEAEWERAAGWDGARHWVYGFMSDTLGEYSYSRCNYTNIEMAVDPFCLGGDPDYPACTSPVGWFNGINVSQRGGITTVDSPSPAGAYDMSGNVMEWCGDWYLDTYYSGGAMANPTGPGTGANRVIRGGSYYSSFGACRSTYRTSSPPYAPDYFYDGVGFRVVRSM